MDILPEPKGKQKEVLALPGLGHHVVLGTAGSGKTVMAIHRSARLANPLSSTAGKVLLCTFNRALVAYLRYWQPAALISVVFENYHRFALGYLSHRGKIGPTSVCKEPERTNLIEEAVATVRANPPALAGVEALLDRPRRWFADEILFINQYGFDLDGYRATDRFGRGAGLGRELRPAVWAVREEYLRLRLERGRSCDWDDVALAVLAELATDGDQRMYRHVVIDEGQDFSPVMLRSLAAAIPEDGSLTFFGDMAQQIYGRQVSWRQAGLHVPDGVWKFKRNYRNTPEIAALGLAISGMPYFTDVPDMVEPDEFEPSGPKPSLVRFESYTEETNFVIERARDAAQTGSVGVLMRRHGDEARFSQAFRAGQRLHRNMPTWRPGPGISYGTVNSAKGYEFDQVFLIGLSDNYWPEPEAIRNDGETTATANDGRLLYVGVTRAKRELVMTHVGESTRLLPPNDDLYLEQTA